MLRVMSKKTYRILKAMLSEKGFKQRKLARELKVSPARVNEVTKWLEKNNLVEKYKNNYEVLNPIGIVKLFTYFRRMDELRVFSMDLEVEENKLIKYLKKQRVVFCLGSALQEYSSYFRDPTMNFYTQNFDKIREELKTLQPGVRRVNIYTPDLFLEEDVAERKAMLFTSKLRTIIDLFCDNKAYTAKDLISELWGVKIG